MAIRIRKWFNYWISKDRTNFYGALAGFLILFYLLGAFMTRYGAPDTGARLKLASFVGFLCLVVIYIVHKNLSSYYRFLDLFQDTDHMPLKQISYVNSFCMTVFLIAALVGILVTAYAMEPLWRAIAEWFANRPVTAAKEAPIEYTPTPPPAPNPDMQAFLGEYQNPGPTPAWVSILSAIVEYGAMLLVLILCFYGIRKGAGKVWEFVTRPRHFDEDEKVYLKPTLDILAHMGSPEGQQSPSKTGLKYFLSYEARIRRYYKKQILTGRKRQKCSGLPGEWASPSELEEGAGLDDAMLHRLYEKARYSQAECTEEDWKVLENRADSSAPS